MESLARAWLGSLQDHQQAIRAVEFLRHVLHAARYDPSKRTLNAQAAPVANYLLHNTQAWAFCREIGAYIDTQQEHVLLDRIPEEVMEAAEAVLQREEERAREGWEETEDPMKVQSTLRMLRAKHRAKADQDNERKKVLQQIQHDQKEREAEDRNKRSQSQDQTRQSIPGAAVERARSIEAAPAYSRELTVDDQLKYMKKAHAKAQGKDKERQAILDKIKYSREHREEL
jgi:hypothetical protein